MRRMLADMTLSELFEWYDHLTDMYEPTTTHTVTPSATCKSAEEEIAMLKAVMGGR